jgi:hypothetical protein
MYDPNSPILDFFPLDFELVLNGKKQDWEAIVKIPFMDGELHSIRLPQDDNDGHDAHGIPGAVSVLARRDSFIKRVDVEIHAPLLQNLQQLRRVQSLEQRAEWSVARLFFVCGYVSHSSVLDTSGTFININPLESELFKLRCRMSLL